MSGDLECRQLSKLSDHGNVLVLHLLDDHSGGRVLDEFHGGCDTQQLVLLYGEYGSQ